MTKPLELQSEGFLEQAIGRNIICDNGTSHRVVTICPSLKHKDRILINETDEESGAGYYVHTLSLVCQIMGKPLPSRDAMAAASRVWEDMYYRETDPNKKVAGWKKNESGLIVPS